MKYIPQINNLNRDVNEHNNELYKLSNAQIDQANLFTTSVNKLNA